MFTRGSLQTPKLSLTETQALAYWTGWCIYALFFHPLAKFPGPRLAALTVVDSKPLQGCCRVLEILTRRQLWHVVAIPTGRDHLILRNLHRIYGGKHHLQPTSTRLAMLIQLGSDQFPRPCGSRRPQQIVFRCGPLFQSHKRQIISERCHVRAARPSDRRGPHSGHRGPCHCSQEARPWIQCLGSQVTPRDDSLARRPVYQSAAEAQRSPGKQRRCHG